jgi:hypothetical protein
MSWAADLFYLLCGATGVPDAQVHTTAQLVVAWGCLLLMVAAGSALAWLVSTNSDEDRMHLPTRARIRHDLASCISTAKEV